MTKAELIKKSARISGVSDSDSKIFFEIFLRKLESHLSLKQSLIIPGLGYFELKKDYSQSKEGSVKLDVICFSQQKGSGEQLIFNVPGEAEQSSSLDSYFSPSFGKPVIPLEGVSNSELFIPHSGIEHEKLLESKADKLLDGIDVTESIEEPLKSQTLPEKEFHKPEKKEINWKSVPFTSNQEELEEQTPSEDSENISWNFGGDFDDEADVNQPVQTTLQEFEDKNAETASDKAEEPEDEEKIQATYIEDKVDVFDQNEQKIYTDEGDQLHLETGSGEVRLEQQTEEIEKTGIPQEPIAYNPRALEEIKPELFSIDDYEKVEPLVASSLARDQEFVSEEDAHIHTDEDIVDEEGYTRVTSKILSLLRMKEKKEEKMESPINEMINHSKEDISDDPGYDKDKVEEESDIEEKEIQGKSRKSLIVVVVLAAIIVIGGGYYLYTYYFGEKSFDTVITPPKVKDKSNAVIIERNYDYPVTYPYNKNTIVGLFDGINQDSFKTVLKEVQPQNSSSISAVETYEARPSKFVKGYIYKYDGFYAVQVSSWKSLSIAKSEMMKFKNGGFDAFLEEAQVKGKTYYRVRIGGFKTIEEVEAFLRK
jgi:hypothetical protein